jgi:gliding motility-associated-like protein
MKKLLIVFCVLFLPYYSNAQFVNKEVEITIKDNSLVVIDMDVINSGLINHDGEIRIKGDWYNGEITGGFNLNSKGVVDFNGDVQNISGIFPAFFPSLKLSGIGIKQLTQDAFVFGNLNIADREFKVNDKILTLLNENVNSLERTSGFISTDNKGMFYRYTNAEVDYYFPLGTNIAGSFYYRPINLKPKDQNKNIFGVSFIPNDPSLDGHQRDSKRDNITQINSKYYHILDQQYGSSGAYVNLFHNYPEDEPFDQLVNYTKFSIWEKVGSKQENNGDGQNNRNISFMPIVRMENLPIALSSSDISHTLTFFNSFSPDGDGKNDLWTIGNIDNYPDNEINIFNRWGGEVFKTKSYSSTNKWNGSGLNNGTYYYLLKVKIDSEYKVFKGFITLIKDQQR